MSIIKNLLIVGAITVMPIYTYANSSGTLIVRGGVSESTCEISTADQNKIVILPVIGKNSLTTTGSVAGTTKFSISLEKCPSALTSAGLFFEAGPSIFPDSGYMKAYKYGTTLPTGNASLNSFPVAVTDKETALTAEASASSTVSPNLAFQLLDSLGNKVDIGSSSQTSQSGLFVNLTTVSGNAAGTYHGAVEYINYSGSAIVSGYYFSHVGFTIQYP